MKLEFQHKKDLAEGEKARKQNEKEMNESWRKTKAQLDYLAKLTGIAFEEITFQEEKMQGAAKSPGKKRV